MDHPVVHFSTVFMALFAIMNPITNTPIFIGITDGMDVALRRSVALRGVLLALPLLAGPGTLATAMNFSSSASDVEILRVLVAVAVICLLNFLAFNSANTLVRFLGQNAIKVVSRLMGLILAVIGVQMLIEGIRGAIAA